MNIKVSVIVPVYNRAHLIRRCLDSVMGQTRKPSELIVVDNGSTDSTREEVTRWIDENRGYGIKMKLTEEPERGACNARQKGLKEAEGDLVIFFDSDDEMRPRLIECSLERFKEKPETDIVCWPCRIKLLDGSHKIPPFLPNKALEGHLIHALLRPQGYMVKRDFLEKAGGWGKKVEVWNDFELGLRLLLNNPKIEGIDEILADIYSQKDSITGENFTSREGIWEKTIGEMERENHLGNHKKKKKIDGMLNYRRAILAAHYAREGNESGAKKLIKRAKEGKSLKERIVLDFSYHYTRKGLRGAWRLVRHFF
ncbi:MAG: glycosyltransferase family 2 protein [Muribaculaceae bacterium]|nr:glycosyltransferase family 2 protein [Muribaculaceae bacterium]